jgi:hypothetical protein
MLENTKQWLVCFNVNKSFLKPQFNLIVQTLGILGKMSPYPVYSSTTPNPILNPPNQV